MNGHGLQDGDDYAVIVFWNSVEIMQVTGTLISPTETSASLYTDSDEELLAASEILKLAVNGAKFYLEKPRLQEMLRERIRQLKEEDEGVSEDNPPTPSIDDIPF